MHREQTRHVDRAALTDAAIVGHFCRHRVGGARVGIMPEVVGICNVTAGDGRRSEYLRHDRTILQCYRNGKRGPVIYRIGYIDINGIGEGIAGNVLKIRRKEYRTAVACRHGNRPGLNIAAGVRHLAGIGSCGQATEDIACLRAGSDRRRADQRISQRRPAIGYANGQGAVAAAGAGRCLCRKGR